MSEDLKKINDTLAKITARLEKLENPKIDEHPEIMAEVEKVSATISEKALVPTIIELVKDIKKQIPDLVRQEALNLVSDIRKEAKEQLYAGIFGKEGPSITLSTLEPMIDEILRKRTLETQPPGKRTETVIKDKPTEGAESVSPVKPAKELFEELQKKRGAP